MAKKVPLLRKLEIALLENSDGLKKDEIFGLAGRYIKAKYSNKEIFYGHLNSKTLDVDLNKKKITSKDINLGKTLYEILVNSINLPSPSLASTNSKKYIKKLKGAMDYEYEKIMEFLENE